MKRISSSTLILLFASMIFGQVKSDGIKLGLFSAHPYNYEYLNGKVKEVHYRTFHISEEDGKIVKGKPFTWRDSDGVLSRQHRSFYYNEPGQLVKLTITVNPDTHWTGIVHYANERIENIYWSKGDSLLFNWDFTYQDNGDMKRQWISIQNNEPTGKQVFVFDPDGNVIKQMNYNEKGEPTFTNEFTRHANGTLKTQKAMDAEGKTTVYISDWKSNDKGLIVSSYLNILGGEEVNRPSTEIEYEYDESGNWNKRFSRGEMLTERSIKYYK